MIEVKKHNTTISFKCLNIFGLIITTEKQLNLSTVKSKFSFKDVLAQTKGGLE